MPKTVVVVGVCGLLGRHVAKTLNGIPDFMFRFFTSDLTEIAGQELDGLSAISLVADVNGVYDNLLETLKFADGIFVTTETEYSKIDALDQEIERGTTIARACSESRVPHIVFSTQLNTKTAIGVVARHMVAKAEIERHMQEMRLPLTSIIVPCLYESLYGELSPVKRPDSSYAIQIPMGNVPLDLISAEDVGVIVAAIFNDRSRFLGKTVSCSGDKLTVQEMTDILSKEVDITIKDAHLTVSQFARLPGAHVRDLAVMFDFFMRVDQRHSVRSTKRLNSRLQSYSEWTKRNATAIFTFLQSLYVSDTSEEALF